MIIHSNDHSARKVHPQLNNQKPRFQPMTFRKGEDLCLDHNLIHFSFSRYCNWMSHLGKQSRLTVNCF